MKPLGNKILVRDIRTEETIDGGKIVLLEETRANLTTQQSEVVATGPGGRDEDGDLVPMDERLVAGAWIVHRPFCRIPSDQDGLFFITQTDVVAILDG